MTVSVEITFTAVGLAAVVNAENTGTAPVTIAEVGIGSGQYVPDGSETALNTEIKRLATIAGTVVSDNQISVTIRDDSADVYDMYEFGLFLGDGTLLGVFSQVGTPIFQKAADTTLLQVHDIDLTQISAASVTFGDTTFAYPPASETVEGVVDFPTIRAVIGDPLFPADQLIATPGSANAPGLIFDGDSNTGWYLAGDNDLRAATGGSDALRLQAAEITAERTLLLSGNPLVAGPQGPNSPGDPGGTTRGITLFNEIVRSPRFDGDWAGSASFPNYTWKFDDNTGIFWAGSGAIGMSSNSTERLRVDGSGVTVNGLLGANGVVGGGQDIDGFGFIDFGSIHGDYRQVIRAFTATDTGTFSWPTAFSTGPFVVFLAVNSNTSTAQIAVYDVTSTTFRVRTNRPGETHYIMGIGT